MSTTGRPLGVTVIGAFWIVRSLLSLLIGLIAILFGGAAIAADLAPRIEPLANLFGGLAALAGIVMVTIGLLQLLLSWGLLSGGYWAWLIAVILEGIRALTSLFGILKAPLFEAALIFIHIITLIYLLLPHVRAYFRRMGAPKMRLPPPPTSQV